MESFAGYLFKSAIWLTGFSLIYFLFLRNERFFRIKRLYLVAGILASFLFPMISFHYKVEMPALQTQVPDMITQPVRDYSPNAAITERNTFDYRYVLLFLYITGIVLLLFRMIRHLRTLSRIIEKAEISDHGQARIAKVAGIPSSFSFFNYVFISAAVKEAEAKQILNHEEVHVRQKHWFDLILAELIRIFQWANPFAWIYTGFIKQNHEYLADEAALKQTANPADYRATLMNQIFNAPVISLSNSFSYSINKKRFEMMKKTITSPYRKLKVLLVLPVFAIVFYAFATPEYNYVTPTDDGTTITKNAIVIVKNLKGVVLKEDGTPLPGAAILVAGTKIRATSDASGNFNLAEVPEDAFIVISCRGYLTQFLKAEFVSMMSVKLLKDPDYKETELSIISGRPDPSAISLQIDETWNTLPAALIVIDGKESSREELEKINPSNIFSMNVLKGASATKTFGEKGKNGVIIITLKPEDLKNQKIVKGTVLNKEGKPVENASIMSTGKLGEAQRVLTDQVGRFSITIPPDATLFVNREGYAGKTIKPPFDTELRIVLEKASEAIPHIDTLEMMKKKADVLSFKPEPLYILNGQEVSKNEIKALDISRIRNVSVLKNQAAIDTYGEKAKEGVVVITTNDFKPSPIIVIDDVISTLPYEDVMKEIRDQIGVAKMLSPKDAVAKYGEKARFGAYEITTIKRAKELGIKIPLQRKNPEDFPTFQGKNAISFADWVAARIKYPAETISAGLQGLAIANFTIETDGSISNVKYTLAPDKIIGEALVKAVQSSPKWDPAKNPEANEPFTTSVTINFELPGKVSTDNVPFVVVEQMPIFPGGDAELLKFIGENTNYPDSAKAKNIQGRVIVRFAISNTGKVGNISVLKGVDPLLDEEAIRVTKMLPDFTPGYQGGKPVSVWYMIPITFTLK
jgi:TonB family protein